MRLSHHPFVNLRCTLKLNETVGIFIINVRKQFIAEIIHLRLVNLDPILFDRLLIVIFFLSFFKKNYLFLNIFFWLCPIWLPMFYFFSIK